MYKKLSTTDKSNCMMISCLSKLFGQWTIVVNSDTIWVSILFIHFRVEADRNVGNETK